MQQLLSPSQLRAWLLGPEEVALVDPREQGEFSDGHLLSACNVPLSHFEARIPALIPRKGCKVVLCDEDDGSGEVAGEVLRRGGYREVSHLRDGIRSWVREGGTLFSGINVPSKAFGEYVEQRFDTPRIEPLNLYRRLRNREDIVILDARPGSEFEVMSIPGAIDTPGAELVHRIRDLAPDPSTTIVVNCAGRTRSIIGCQSLINAAVANPVFALKDGTMGWALAGLPLSHGADASLSPVSESAVSWAINAADAVAERFQVAAIDTDTLQRWRDERDRHTCYVFDVRQPDEYVSGHLVDARSAPGGQLVQATDAFVAVRNSRIVLVDDNGVRARMTASWLIQMGYPNVCVLQGGLLGHELVEGSEQRSTLTPVPDLPEISAVQLARMKSVQVVDFSPSLSFRAGHIEGASWGIRSKLPQWQSELRDAQHYVVCADSLEHAQRSGADLRTYRENVSVLAGTRQSWVAAGLAIGMGMHGALCKPKDVFYRPYDGDSPNTSAMRAYLAWEMALMERVDRDATIVFPHFG